MSIEEMMGMLPIKQKLFIPFRDQNGVPIDKYMTVTVGGSLHAQILEAGNGKMPEYFIEIQKETGESK